LNKLSVKLGKYLAAGVMLAAVMAPVVAEAQTTRHVNANRALATAHLNVRQGPGSRYPVVDVLRRGEEVRIIQCRGNFCMIEHEGPQGWVSRNYLQTLIAKPS
jgi:uncharacterized protein YraI